MKLGIILVQESGSRRLSFKFHTSLALYLATFIVPDMISNLSRKTKKAVMPLLCHKEHFAILLSIMVYRITGRQTCCSFVSLITFQYKESSLQKQAFLSRSSSNPVSTFWCLRNLDFPSRKKVQQQCLCCLWILQVFPDQQLE